MATLDPTARLALACRALGDENRLRLIALLARRPHYGEELAEFLGLSAATVSHHLRTLRELGLVQGRRESPYVLYSLHELDLLELLQPLLELRALAEHLGLPSEEQLSRSILRGLLDQQDRLREIPTARRPRAVALRWAAHHLDTDRLYPERELRLALMSLHREPDALRDALLGTGWLQRSGAVFRRIEEVDAT